MYNSFYSLNQNPFRLTPNPAFLYITAKHREALAGLVYSVCNRAGLTVLVGEAGTGKTTLLHVLKDWLAKRQFITALCTNPTLNRAEFLDTLLSQLGINCSSSLKSRQLVALESTLRERQAEGKRSVLIVDEAHRLSPELLEEIRLLLNIESAEEKFLEIILAGQPELTDLLRRPELRQFKQRVNCYCRLEALTIEETREYINHRLTQAGLPQPAIFPQDTIPIIHEYTQGIPRLVSSLCDSSLQTGFALQSNPVTLSIIHEAAKDLDLLTDELQLEPEPTSHATVIPAEATVSHTTQNGTSKAAAPVDPRVEAYPNPQESVGFFASLINRWT